MAAPARMTLKSPAPRTLTGATHRNRFTFVQWLSGNTFGDGGAVWEPYLRAPAAARFWKTMGFAT
jgi:hypothetical protein